MTTAELLRFYDKVQFATEPAGCWLWQANRNRRGGYGRFRLNGKLEVAHRVAYRAFCGPIPDGQTLDHLCKNTQCVNPFHLEPVSVAENIRRGTQGWNMRIRTHCPQGHPYNEENTYINSRNERICRVCGRERMRERRAKS